MADKLSGNDPGKILLIGVTGGTGHQAVRGLKAQGLTQLVAMTRDPEKPTSAALDSLGVTLVQGDLDNSASITRAMKGIDAVYLHALSHDTHNADPEEVTRGKAVARAAAEAGVRHLIYNSVDGCERNSGVPHMEFTYQVEQALDQAGVPNTVLRATLFMEEWWKHYTRPGIVQGAYRVTHAADFKQQLIAVRDMGYIAGQLFKNPSDAIGRKIAVAADSLTPVEMASRYSDAQDIPVTFQALPLDLFRNAPNSGELVQLIEWYDNFGHQVDVAAVQSEFPGIWTMEDFLRETDWGNPQRSYESFSNGSIDQIDN